MKCFLIPDEFASVEEAIAAHLGFCTRLHVLLKKNEIPVGFLIVLIKHGDFE